MKKQFSKFFLALILISFILPFSEECNENCHRDLKGPHIHFEPLDSFSISNADDIGFTATYVSANPGTYPIKYPHKYL